MGRKEVYIELSAEFEENEPLDETLFIEGVIKVLEDALSDFVIKYPGVTFEEIPYLDVDLGDAIPPKEPPKMNALKIDYLDDDPESNYLRDMYGIGRKEEGPVIIE